MWYEDPRLIEVDLETGVFRVAAPGTANNPIQIDDSASEDGGDDDDDWQPAGGTGRSRRQISSGSESEGAPAQPAFQDLACRTLLGEYQQWARDHRANLAKSLAVVGSISDATVACLREEIEKRARYIIPTDDFTDLSLEQVKDLFLAIDNVFYGDALMSFCGSQITLGQNAFTQDRRRLPPGLSIRFLAASATKAAHCGWLHRQRHLEVGVAKSVFLQLPAGSGSRVDGRDCASRRACLLEVMLHETTHAVLQTTAVEYRLERRKRQWQVHGDMFRAINRNLFGHTDVGHLLFSRDLGESVTRESLKVGDLVSFIVNGQLITEPVTKLNPRKAKAGRWSVPYMLLKRPPAETSL